MELDVGQERESFGIQGVLYLYTIIGIEICACIVEYNADFPGGFIAKPYWLERSLRIQFKTSEESDDKGEGR